MNTFARSAGIRCVTILALSVVFSSHRATAAANDAPHPVLLEVEWQQFKAAGKLKSGEVVADDKLHKNVLKIVSPAKTVSPGGIPIVVPLFDIEAPKISKRVYTFSGSVRYEGVEGTAFLEMWNVFPDGSHFFTRTLGTFGPMQSLQGSSDWRPIQLPSQLSEDPSKRPNRLVLNADFQGPGTVWLSDLTLNESDTFELTTPGAWWDDRTAGLIGGLGGALIGLIGAALGVLASRGAARKLVISAMASSMALGVALLGVGIVAVAIKQPYAVFYPLLLCGALCLILGTVGLIVSRYLYSRLELRRMQALDADR